MRKLRAAVVVGAVTGAFVLGGTADGKNASSCTFSRGETICTTVHGSHGTESGHHGQVNSNGSVTQEPTPCKVTGPEHTC